MMVRHQNLFALSLIFLASRSQVFAKSGKLLFRTSDGIEHEISSKNCSGVYLKTEGRVQFECACISGVWIFYTEFCGEPSFFLGGHNYCFGLDSFPDLTQVAQIGNYRDAFEPSIGHFQKENFIQLTTTISENEFHEYNRLELDTLGSWITVTNTEWTLHGDTGESICLHPTVPGYRVICTYNKLLQDALERNKWNYIVHVQKGCHSNVTVKADACYPLKQPNDKSKCKETEPVMKPCPDPNKINDVNPQDDFCEEKIEITTLPPITTTPKPICGDITRDVVKRYWLDPVNNQCAKSLNEAILTDQLRRFATTRFNQQFDSRLQSLDYMKQLIGHSKDIMKKTCSDDYVPGEFFDVATDAFLMFINEDFFYGVEGIDQISFERVLNSLKKCWKRANAFVYESERLGCNLKKITGTLILPGEKVDITIPDNSKSKHFEPLIETTWKVFLNAHAYCFEDFQIPNDHHHFSVLFLELFSKTIYEKWIEPLTNKELYKFIVPKYEVMNNIMENVDYCVAATGYGSKCPVWMTRSNPLAKPILDSSDEGRSTFSKTIAIVNDSGSSRSRRTKRSTWIRGIYNERTSIWDGSAYCLQNMVDPSRLGLASCTEAF